jgi:P27 family predicted phage terminase small subunit
MKPGTKPKPTHLRLVTGNPGRRPLNRSEAKLKLALPMPPPELSDDAKVEWGRVSHQLYAAGILTNLDRAALAAYCQAHGRWMQAERALAKMAESDKVFGGFLVKTSNGKAIRNPLVGIANKAMSDMIRYAAEFGMTPSARSRIEVTPPIQVEDPTSEFFA